MKHSRSSLFLMELIIAILFFSLTGAVCIQLFVKAHLISRSTIELNHAIVQAQNLAEIWLSADAAEQPAPLYFDDDWNPCTQASSEAAGYTAALQSETEAQTGLVHAHITVTALSGQSAREIYTLDVDHHPAERRGQLEP